MIKSILSFSSLIMFIMMFFYLLVGVFEVHDTGSIINVFLFISTSCWLTFLTVFFLVKMKK
jgi:hypothetical protein